MADAQDPDRLLQVQELDVAYGAIRVVWGLSLEVHRQQVVSLIGPNGAGKTTLLKAIAGLLPVRSGSIRFDGEDISSEPANERVRHHLSLVPEGRQLWPRMTVEENLLMGAFPAHLRSKSRSNLERIYELFPRLKERRHQLSGTLSGGEQQMCAIGRGLMAEPLLLLLDEPSLGLAPILVDQVFQLVQRIAKEGVTILVAAQNADYALEISQRCYVMESGRITLEGPSEELRVSDHVRRAYLGAGV
jgi:branched-chain amino acid transport system ATP-binding protein